MTLTLTLTLTLPNLQSGERARRERPATLRPGVTEEVSLTLPLTLPLTLALTLTLALPSP